MKVKVVSIFRDKYTHKLYNPGEVIEIVDESRVKDLEVAILPSVSRLPKKRRRLKSPFLNKNSRKRLL